MINELLGLFPRVTPPADAAAPSVRARCKLEVLSTTAGGARVTSVT